MAAFFPSGYGYGHAVCLHGMGRKSSRDTMYRSITSTIDVLEVTHNVVVNVGVDTIVENIEDPMPGSTPEQDLGHMWITAVAREVTANLEETSQDANKSKKEQSF